MYSYKLNAICRPHWALSLDCCGIISIPFDIKVIIVNMKRSRVKIKKNTEQVYIRIGCFIKASYYFVPFCLYFSSGLAPTRNGYVRVHCF